MSRLDQGPQSREHCRAARADREVEQKISGRAVFTKDGQRLEVFTANRRNLEHVFGVDLIYLNASRQNIVSCSTRCSTRCAKSATRTGYTARTPKSTKKSGACARSRLVIRQKPHEYRLNPEVFYLKLVKRDAQVRGGGIIMPIDHFKQLRKDPACNGPKGGLRISYESLAGRYSRQGAFLDLIRSGYIGAHGETTQHLKTLAKAVVCTETLSELMP
jgi:hypothetical protein